ncbi:unnamed protein product [Cuscuta epithymum]|uniref:Uncharacterized protein n=1 Tax=Cuscuta epithymum TaxID=186058 RepID=A0AAV0C0F3_9ASTE|nr:unnamed protein product [Cuscuta epithymum]
MEEIANQYKDMAIGDQEEDLIFEDEPLEDEGGSVIGDVSPIVGTVITDRMVKFPVLRDLMASLWRSGKGHVGRFCPLVYENIYVDTNQQYGVSLRAGGGGKACWGGDKWLVPEGSRDGSMAVREDGERAGPSRQGWELSLAGNIKSRTEDEETTVVDGTSGDPKRRRTWEEDSGERDEGKTWPWTTQKPERGRV